MDLNDLMKMAESDLVKWIVSRVMTGVLNAVPWLSAVSGPLGWIISLGVSFVVKYGDFAIYWFADGSMNSAHGETYQKAGEELEKLPPDAPKEKRDELKKAKSDAFDVLMGA